MEPRWKYIRIFTLIFFVVLCISTLQPAGLQGLASAQTTGKARAVWTGSATGSINYSSRMPSNNLIPNPDFSQGFSGWGGYTGWRGDQNAHGYAFLDNSTYRNTAPSLRLEPDPYGITPGDPAVWVDPRIAAKGEVTLRAGVWVKTDKNPNYPYNTNTPYGARMMVDFWDNSQNDLTNEGFYQIINSTVPVVDGCPVVSWGTTSWTLIEIYVKATNLNTVWAVLWLQVYPSQSGVTLSCWFDDAYCVLVG
jgi:hypothetical protein